VNKKKRFGWRAIALVGIAGAVAAGGTAMAVTRGTHGSPGSDRDPATFAPRRGAVPQISGTPDAVVRALAARLPLVLSAQVKTEQIPGEAGTAASEGLVLEYRLSVPTLTGPSITKALWEGNLLTGAVADEYVARGFGRVVGANATLVAPDGAEQPIGGGIGHVVPDQVFDDVPNSIAATVARGGATASLRNISVSKVRGLQEALVVSATTDSPAHAAAALAQPGGLQSVLGGAPTRFEGIYLEVRNAAGDLVYITAAAPRAGASTFWVASGLGVAPRGRFTTPSAGAK
jgi:hypothetical protein